MTNTASPSHSTARAYEVALATRARRSFAGPPRSSAPLRGSLRSAVSGCTGQPRPAALIDRLGPGGAGLGRNAAA
jgi:hypothetical protein